MIQLAMTIPLFSKDEWERQKKEFDKLDKKKLKRLIQAHILFRDVKNNPELLKNFKDEINANTDKTE